MNTLPLNIGTIHFVGIGGIGMSGIAEILHNLGYTVQGSDISDNANVQRLRDLGIRVFVGHQAANVEDAKVVVISTAVKPDNPEVVAARADMIPVVRRSEMLAELMRLKAAIAVGGTHGKTTTTSLVATMLDAAGLDPTVINGGIINSYGTNARLGDGDWMVVEADESDGTFVKVPSTISVVTNIDPEHLDHWKNFDQLREAFKNFVQNIPFYGFAVLCIDHPEVQALIGKVTDRRIFTFGFSPQADVRAVNVRTEIGQSTFDVVIRERVDSAERVIKDVRLPMVGDHNVSNSLAAITVALELGIADDKIVSAFDGFTGVKRRFTKTGEVDGVTIIDDYGHHPVEIKAVLKAARKATGNNVIAVVQPHRYSRLHDLFEEFCTCFNDADSVIVADVYEAGESPIEGASRDALVEGLRNRGHRHVAALEGPEALASMIAKEAKPGDLVVCLGAGSISAWANALPAQLEALKN
ncbi:UDP-N-acetylmuramate--L-alanine ligase [Thalassospira xiamenensis M-5 = DSM 17429]|uniref:UDP-N-acetylmuramate--L-alanine ligase n=1 Tax=Thalassospira xiamenensis M-5 = DSM 17429 TaxID=1123366 RepID=A0AB72UGF7_9PROT|nr:UDP-N-acetylmuramate--L-alanine ligase [Thalassospira xiamenensis]AJD53269.1 UDP-N-acetylmuramate--L-alanine ligase [Thalassospira xiamenensis M-5 = DSM 17429]SIT26265.1 UDP-N-acetylmuramate--L-alanine ligase [Thalassospira xiamenensis M-5 = DSM 17429]